MNPMPAARAAGRHAPAASTPASTWIRASARTGAAAARRAGAPPTAPSRSYISPRVLEILRHTPAGRAGLQAFQFQAVGMCHPNTARMTVRAVEVLVAGGDAHRNRLVAYLARMLPNLGLAEMNPPVTPSSLANMNRRHGPLQLVTHHGLQPGQGDDAYRDFHAVVKLAGFEHRGRQVALLLDGNDRQSNPATQALRDWMRASDDRRDLGQLDNAQLQALDACMRDHHREQPSVFQAAFRLVDLEQMVAASLVTGPPQANGDPGLKVLRPLLPAAAVDALREAVDEDPKLVEGFAPPHASQTRDARRA